MKMRDTSTDGPSARWFKAFNTATTSGLLHNQISPPKRTNENEKWEIFTGHHAGLTPDLVREQGERRYRVLSCGQPDYCSQVAEANELTEKDGRK